jgi:transposase
VRGRDDAVIAQRRVRQQLKALLLRNDIRYVGRTSWTGAHRRWLSELRLPEPAQQIAFEEYVDAIAVATSRIERLTRGIVTEVLSWRFAPVAAALQALRGIQFVHAVTLVAELGDLTRLPRRGNQATWAWCRAKLLRSTGARARSQGGQQLAPALARRPGPIAIRRGSRASSPAG